MKTLETLNVAKTFTTSEELISSTEYKNIWEGWQGMDRNSLRIKKYRFISGYVVNSTEGGQSELYWHYETPDGFECIAKIAVSSTLSSSDMQLCMFVNSEGSGNPQIAIMDLYMQKTNAGRLALSNQNVYKWFRK